MNSVSSTSSWLRIHKPCAIHLLALHNAIRIQGINSFVLPGVRGSYVRESLEPSALLSARSVGSTASGSLHVAEGATLSARSRNGIKDFFWTDEHSLRGKTLDHRRSGNQRSSLSSRSAAGQGHAAGSSLTIVRTQVLHYLFGVAPRARVLQHQLKNAIPACSAGTELRRDRETSGSGIQVCAHPSRSSGGSVEFTRSVPVERTAPSFERTRVFHRCPGARASLRQRALSIPVSALYKCVEEVQYLLVPQRRPVYLVGSKHSSSK